MYVPAAFRETDQQTLFDFIEAHSFGLMVSPADGQLQATHLPLLLNREVGERGQLIGHLARANPHWRALAGQEVLVVFSGPHAYISPTWYESTDVVPTWNYVAVHVYGVCRVVDDERETGDIVEAYVTTYERSMERPWTIDRRGDFFRRLIQAVVGFRIDISRIEGKWKLGQNHAIERRQYAIRHLDECASADAHAIARLMVETLDG